MAPELGFWHWLCARDEGPPFLLRQRLPDVCVFRGCVLEAMYGTGSGGFAVCHRGVGFEDFVRGVREANRSADATREGAPIAAVLRRRPTVSSTGEQEAGTVPGLPHATVLSVADLQGLAQRLEAASPPSCDVWSVQAFVRPIDNLRIVSVYSRDARGCERTDIFGRPYNGVYCFPDAVSVPSPEDVACDQCIPINEDLRRKVEMKTLGIIRFAERFHDADLEGLVLEFVVDVFGHVIVHGCWCVSTWSGQLRRRVPASSSKKYLQPSPGPYQVPVTETCRAPRRSVNPGPVVLLELWAGDMFLGECYLPLRPARSPPGVDNVADDAVWSAADLADAADARAREESKWHSLCLLDDASCAAAPSRPDERKRRAAAAGAQVSAAFVCLRSRDGMDALRFGPTRAELPHSLSGGAVTRRPRILLWRRSGHERDAGDGFTVLWASREAPHASAASWEECIEIPLGPAGSVAAPSFQADADSTLGGADKHEDFGGSSIDADSSIFVGARRDCVGTSDASTFSPPYRSGYKGKNAEAWPPHMAKEIPSKNAHVCGAHLTAHWGISEEDGSMKTNVLVAQVAQRFGVSGRSSLLHVIAKQLQGLHDMQCAWAAELESIEDSVNDDRAKLAQRENTIARLRQEADAVIANFKQQLATTCKEKCAAVDVHRKQDHTYRGEIALSRRRLQEQRALFDKLVSDNASQQEVIANTIKKYEELALQNSSVMMLPKDRRVMANAGAGSEAVDGVQSGTDRLRQAQQLASQTIEDLHASRSELLSQRAELARLREQTAAERALAQRFEGLVKKVALAPSSTLRTGGGYLLDSAAKREAVALLRAMQAGEPLPPSMSWDDAAQVIE